MRRRPLEKRAGHISSTDRQLLTCLSVRSGFDLLLESLRLSVNSEVLLSALVVLLLNPADLFRVGTQLSFLAVGTLMSFPATWRRWSEKDALARLIVTSRPWPVKAVRAAMRWYWRLTLAGLAVWLVALPLVMHRFHLVSPVGILATPILYLPLAVALLSGLLILLCGWLLPPAAQLAGSVCDTSLRFMQWTVDTVRDLPGGFFWVPGPDGWWLAGFYGGLAIWALAPRRHFPWRWGVAALCGWIVAGVVWSQLSSRKDHLECTFLSVGHGCAVVLELPDGRTMLYDAGRLGAPQSSARSVANFLWSRGYTHLDAIVISHSDADHYNAVPELFEQFSVGVVYVSPVMANTLNAAAPRSSLGALKKAIDRAGVGVREIYAGNRIAAEQVEFHVLHPPRHGVIAPDLASTDNANSLVLDVRYRHRRILLTGDLESPGLEDVMAEEPVPCDVLLAPHHGSPRSNPSGFARWSRPSYTVVSGGANLRRQGDVARLQKAYEGVGSRLIHTARQGAVQVVVDERLEIRVWRGPAR